VSDAQVDTELENIREFLASRNSEVTEVQKWGRRKLAYEIKKNKEGIYTLIRFNAEQGVPAELNRRYRLNENLLRYLTVLYEKPPVEERPPEEEGKEPEAGTAEPETKSPAAAAEDASGDAPAPTPAPAPDGEAEAGEPEAEKPAE
jgi:small subunit ribosomal protein S6